LVLKGEFMDRPFDSYGYPAPRIHPSSIDHLPVTRGITKAVAMPHSCILSGPNGNLRFWCFDEVRKYLDAEFFTSFSPIKALQITELWVGKSADGHFYARRTPWKQTVDGVIRAFKVLTKVEDLTIVGCETEALFPTLGPTAEEGILLPRLRKLTVYVAWGDFKILALIRSMSARKGCSQPLEVTIVLEKEPDVDFLREVDPLRELVGELTCCAGDTPKLAWLGDGGGVW
jgi:hypothetical protein